MPRNALRMCYELTTILESGVRGQNFEQLKTFATNSRSLKTWKTTNIYESVKNLTNWLRFNNES